MNKELHNNFTNSSDLTSREAYDFYKNKRKKVAEGINDYNLYKKAVGGVFTVIRDMMIESEGGVYLEGFGYLCMVKYPKKRKKKSLKNKSLFRKLLKYQYYFPYFLPDVELKGWTMSDAFEDTLINKINAQKIEYKLHFDLVSTIRVANDYAKKIKDSRKVRGEFKYNSRLIKKLNR